MDVQMIDLTSLNGGYNQFSYNGDDEGQRREAEHEKQGYYYEL